MAFFRVSSGGTDISSITVISQNAASGGRHATGVLTYTATEDCYVNAFATGQGQIDTSRNSASITTNGGTILNQYPNEQLIKGALIYLPTGASCTVQVSGSSSDSDGGYTYKRVYYCAFTIN